MQFTKADISNVMDDLVSVRQKLERWGSDLAEVAERGRMDPYSALIVSAEANVYRALVQLKESYRYWVRIQQTAERYERRRFIEDSPYLTRTEDEDP